MPDAPHCSDGTLTEHATAATTLDTMTRAPGPNWPRWFVVVGAILGGIYVFTMPVTRPLDEPAHLQRVATIDQGAVIPPAFGHTSAAYRIDGCLDALLERATEDFEDVRHHQPTDLSLGARWRLQFENPECGRTRVLHGGGSISNAEINSPVPYLPAMVGFAVGRPLGGALGAVYGARIFQLAAYLTICWWALRRLPWGRPFAAAVALVPTSIAGAAGVSADPITLALALATIAATLHLVRTSEVDPDRTASPRTLIMASALFVALGLCKPAAAPLALLTVIVPTALFGTRRRRLTWVGATIGAVAVTGGAWILAVGSKVHVTTTPHVDSTVTGAWLSSHPWVLPGALWRTLTIPEASRFILGGVATPIGIDVATVPIWITLAGLALFVFARILDPLPRRFAHLGGPNTDRQASAARAQLRLERITGAGIAIAGGVAVVYGIYLASNPVGNPVVAGIQGRYFLPYAPLALLGVRPTRAGTGRLPFHIGVLGALVVLNLYWLIRVLARWQLI